MKRVLSIFVICIICAFSVLPYTQGYYSYADSTTDAWTQVDSTDDLVKAFRYYCESRDLTIDGSSADAVTTWTTRRFNQWCQDTGIDITALQAHIKKTVDGNIITKFLFDSFAIQAYNRIFAQFLQDYNLSEGDTVNDETLFDGKYYGNTLIYSFPFNVSYGDVSSYTSVSNIRVYGTPLQYTNSMLISMYNNNETSFSVTWNEKTASYTMREAAVTVNNEIKRVLTTEDTSKGVIRRDFESNSPKGFGFPIVVNHPDYPRYYCIGIISFFDNDTYSFTTSLNPFTKDNVPTVNIYITTNNNTINNNNYEGDTIINNDGTSSGGSGGSGGDGNDPITPPGTVGGTGSDGTIDFPDFDFKLPEINWSLGDLSQKFPFSIPFDLVAFFTLLNAEPEAPSIDTDIPLGNFYTWHFEADFSQFDNWASIIRNVEFIGFVVGLIYLTIKFVKG